MISIIDGAVVHVDEIRFCGDRHEHKAHISETLDEKLVKCMGQPKNWLLEGK